MQQTGCLRSHMRERKKRREEEEYKKKEMGFRTESGSLIIRALPSRCNDRDQDDMRPFSSKGLAVTRTLKSAKVLDVWI
ncbi:hypothetical protein SUGI_0624830 [Cryptomeria japonica]|nr:hypothetical protein SUGI_0624830 [Cryptomeria japonica]